jgi:hypothetical protein
MYTLIGAYRNPHPTANAIMSDEEEKKSAACSLGLRLVVIDSTLPTARLEMVIVKVNTIRRYRLARGFSLM